MFIARLDTSHYTFHAAGDSEAQALQAMRATWDKHRAQRPDAAPFSEFAEDVVVTEIYAGQGYRDDSLLIRLPSANLQRPEGAH